MPIGSIINKAINNRNYLIGGAAAVSDVVASSILGNNDSLVSNVLTGGIATGGAFAFGSKLFNNTTSNVLGKLGIAAGTSYIVGNRLTNSGKNSYVDYAHKYIEDIMHTTDNGSNNFFINQSLNRNNINEKSGNYYLGRRLANQYVNQGNNNPFVSRGTSYLRF